MKIKEAVSLRILQLCAEKGLAINALANLAGIPPTTIYSLLSKKSANPGIVTIKKICDGLTSESFHFSHANFLQI